MYKQTSYEELLQEMREQVDATLDNIQRGIWSGMDEDKRAYLREHIANTILTCLEIDRAKQEQQRKIDELDKLMKAIEQRTGRML